MVIGGEGKAMAKKCDPAAGAWCANARIMCCRGFMYAARF